ncbi:MAG: oxalurate catabolism protein HpxZ [Actinomycetia bacterium]|nr:oxalurate catabolism protein HpxZ [Actinomycetes bacterium]
MNVNQPGPVAEVTAAFEAYEQALMTNDVEALDGFFRRDSLTIRYGLGENSYGHDAIAAVRRTRAAEPRNLEETVITAYGQDAATADTLFTRTQSGRRGRQSQTWIRFDEGWRIVSAHVSWFDPNN